MAGRKSKFEELQIVERYSDLTEPCFKFILEMLETGDKSDKKWAVEQLAKGYVKMIPQDVTTGGQPIPTPLLHVFHNDSNKEDIQPQAED